MLLANIISVKSTVAVDNKTQVPNIYTTKKIKKEKHIPSVGKNVYGTDMTAAFSGDGGSE